MGTSGQIPTITQLLHNERAENKQLQTTLAAKDKRIEELEADLRKYSDHLPACQISWDEKLSDNCTCGLRQALTKGGE